ncbi:aspartate carbamoyltransferase, partial [Acidianus sp. RZ1]|uniref:aspartate/ornithine carbamoyltransferase family protein n=1 Tax=Acidianus sp. RZ1 TaxID=1540082 RepID=UPI00183781C7|nr:aspartate carbamoyltransferase [Acidianus sp. RZ1]
MEDVISAYDFSRDQYLKIFSLADEILKGRKIKMKEKIIAEAFFEPSTRTALSFSAAAQRLGMNVIGFSSQEGTSVVKGENLADTIRMMENYSDCIVIRHKFDGAAKFAAEVSSKPVINAGDGKHEHPTQTLVDLYTIFKTFNTIDGLNFGLIGDLRYARTVNSLLRGL